MVPSDLNKQKIKKMKKIIISKLLLILIVSAVNAQLTQWRGPNSQGYYPAKNLLKQWPEKGPNLLLSLELVGMGNSQAILHKNVIYVTSKIDSFDYITAIDMSGKTIWNVSYGNSWFKSYPETRCTPTIEDDRIYLLSGSAELVCLGTTDGKKIWQADTEMLFKGGWSKFGTAESPLIVDNLVIVTPGGETTTMVAFDKFTGKLVWQTPLIGGNRPYATPVLYNDNKNRFIVGLTDKFIFGVMPENGNVLWQYEFFPKVKTIIERGAFLTNSPLIYKNEIYVTCGYDIPAVKLAVADDARSVSEVWVDTVLDVHHHGVVLVDGHIYGSNWYNNRRGDIVSLNWETGKPTYNYNWDGKSMVITADNMLYFYEERTGKLGLVKPNPEKFEIVSTFKIAEGTGPHWSHPSIYDGKLFIRHGKVLQVFDIIDPNAKN